VTLLLNILWFIFGGGLVAGVAWLLLGLLLAITVVGIPFAIAAFRIAGFAAWPFGRTLVDARTVGDEQIVGIPFGFAHFRLAAVSFAPLGKRAVDLP
jgi:uncharacterized membrane protein YccF (DUF307 family)